MTDLDPRKKTILRAIIVEYVDSAEPIGSEMLAQKYPLGVKSATVRNEMAELSEMGYLEQPHTSAGRIPSDRGYRFFVDRLILQREVTDGEKQKVRSATEDGDALQTLLRDTVRTMSRMTRLLGVAATVREMDLTVKTAVLSALGPAQALFVLVLSNGHVENRMIECPAGLTLQDVGKANELLSNAIVNRALRPLGRIKAPSAGNPAIDKMLGIVWTQIRAISRELTRGVVVSEGEEYMFAQPEFRRDAGVLDELLRELTESDLLYEAVAPTDAPRVVTIGRENRRETMHQLSVVRHSFFVGDREAGVIALIGPTRMPYETSIPFVNFTARALSESLTRFFG